MNIGGVSGYMLVLEDRRTCYFLGGSICVNRQSLMGGEGGQPEERSIKESEECMGRQQAKTEMRGGVQGSWGSQYIPNLPS